MAAPSSCRRTSPRLSLRMICAYALGSGVTDPEGVVTAFERVLTAHLGKLYRPPRPGPPDEEAERTERADAALRLSARGRSTR
ncbi:hypothetical protein [Streptomyces clavuligerus]|uniref:hypothetical protein n=1 Tax=Streptomyces clavuligerus TaxID=1901 RepID=UPI001F072FFB|nr:hypothetical protein [Streptomyces clavuligerus]